MRSEGVAIAASNAVQIQKTRFTVGTHRGRSTPRWKRRLKREKAGQENGREGDDQSTVKLRSSPEVGSPAPFLLCSISSLVF